MDKLALLVLEEGTVFYGKALGAIGLTVGEVVFNTSMVGYEEILTDPSYALQLVTLTSPHVGNVGINALDEEASKVYAHGLIIRDVSLIASNFRSQEGLEAYLKRQNIVAITEIDTRKLTRLLRKKGAQRGCIMSGSLLDADFALEKAKAFAGLKGMDLAKDVSTAKSYTWEWGTQPLNAKTPFEEKQTDLPYHIVVYDYGVKTNILRMLVDRGCRLTVVPAQTSAEDVLNYHPDGVFLSNGPGDPKPCDYAINAVKVFLDVGIPLFGICLGHQFLALACGGKTVKMQFGHHGSNHPVKDLDTGNVMITSQNHGFAVDENDLPSCLRITHRSLFDQTVQGIHHTTKPAFGFQGHPEAAPGPQDAVSLFDHFIDLIKNNIRSPGMSSCQNAPI